MTATQDGTVLSHVFRGPIDATVFEGFIAQLLQHCEIWPEPKSVLVMNNISFHHSERLAQMCADAGLKLVYLPHCSPDINPIEEFFAKLKGSFGVTGVIMKIVSFRGLMSSWSGVSTWLVSKSAWGHFRHAGLKIEFCDTSNPF